MAELADALDLGSSGSRRGGSSPPFRIQLLAAAIERFTHRHLELETQAMTLTAPFQAAIPKSAGIKE